MANPNPTDNVIKIADRIKRLVGDAWENITSGHGTSRDKRTSTRIKPPEMSSTRRQEFEDLYFGDDLAAKMVDLPAQEMVREWIKINVDMGEPDKRTRGAEADENVSIADDMLQALEELNAKEEFAWAVTMAEVFGGSLIFIAADDGAGLTDIDAMAKPLDVDRIKRIEHLTVFDRWEVEIETEYSDPFNPKFGQPETYRIVQRNSARGSGGATPQVILHETRTVRLDGVRTNSNRRVRNAGWHDSRYTRVIEILGDFGIGFAGAAHALTVFAQAVFKMKGLGEAVSSSEGNLVLDRMAIMDQCRSTIRMIPIDADDEDFAMMNMPLAGVADLLDRFMLRLATAADMPVSVLFGQGPRGLDNTAEGDIEIWSREIHGRQERKLRKGLEYLIELLFKATEGPTKGSEPDGWRVFFNPLFQLDEKEQAETRKLQAETDQLYIDSSVLDPTEVRQSRFGGEEYSAETVLDPEIDEGDKLAKEEPPEPPPFPPPNPALPPPPNPGIPVPVPPEE